jgi:cathepsin L
MKQLLVLFFVVLVFCDRPKWHELDSYSFESYVKDFGKNYSYKESIIRKEIFEKNLADIKNHNNNPSFTWKKGVNHFADQSEEEWAQVRGLNKALLYLEKEKSLPVTLEKVADLPTSVDWREKNIITAVKDQGRCGSCWTFGTAETVESYYALKHNSIMDLSEQQILDCTPNPNDCGGTGGCGGGTAQLAMDRIVAMGGITTEWQYPYTSYFGTAESCKFANVTSNPMAVLSGWNRLTPNDQDSVITALATIGPQIINVDAATWHLYETGIFDGCNQTNPDIDHVVQLVGYGPDYWLVRNSWSSLWGEIGYIRLKKDTTVPCGIDLTPQDGDICNGGPSTVKVCGTCGVVYDVTYPILV